MARDNPVSRRTALKVTGAAATTAFIAGCSDDGGDGNGSENGGDEGFEIEAGETIELEAQTTEWTGVAPSAIEGESNPTLILEADEDYTIGWTEGDDAGHNIELRDENDEVVEDYETEQMSADEIENEEDQMIDFTASDDIAVYRCQPHAQMEGDIQVE